MHCIGEQWRRDNTRVLCNAIYILYSSDRYILNKQQEFTCKGKAKPKQRIKFQTHRKQGKTTNGKQNGE
jgi:hypothetical protein